MDQDSFTWNKFMSKSRWAGSVISNDATKPTCLLLHALVKEVTIKPLIYSTCWRVVVASAKLVHLFTNKRESVDKPYCRQMAAHIGPLLMLTSRGGSRI